MPELQKIRTRAGLQPYTASQLTLDELYAERDRYPRLWIVQTPDSPSYPLASRLHILLRQSDRSHKYRILPSSPILDHWEEWLRYLNARIHI